jgi:phenylalanyl-tRNA synthetase beta chain
VLVCDRNGPSGIAGIMGGQVSEVSEQTTGVLLEVATWNGTNILRTSRMLGLRSEASTRFEKQLHPELAIRAQRVASRLLVELCGAKLVPGTIDVAAEIPAPHRIVLRAGRAERLLGMTVAPELAETYLGRLGFEVEREGEELSAVVPLHRHYDVTREVDLIEEVGRIHGYDTNLPSTLPAVGQAGRLSREQALRRRAEDVMRDLGFHGVVTLSLVDPGMPDRLRLPGADVRHAPIRVANPLSSEHSELRTTLLGSLLDVARYNLAREAERVALFESNRVFLAEGESPVGGVLGGDFAGERRAPAYEPQRIGALAVGALSPGGWREPSVPADFFALKGVLEALATQMGAELALVPGEEPFLHPGRAAGIRIEGHDAGWIGELHPLVCGEWDLPGAVGFELDLALLVSASRIGEESYEDVISYPPVHEDVAVLVDEDVPAETVRAAVLAGGGELLHSARVFDLYRGDQVGSGRKSLALRLSFVASDRTLTDEEVAEVRERIRAKVEEIGGALRE